METLKRYRSGGDQKVHQGGTTLLKPAPKPTLADAQKVVQTISSDKTKLQAYCELGKLQDQMEKAEEGNDPSPRRGASLRAARTA